MTGTPSAPARRPPTRRIGAFIALLAGLLAIALAGTTGTSPPAPAPASLLALPLLVGLLVAAEYLFVGFRYRGQVDTWNLMEAALAPLLFAYDPLVVAGAVGVAQVCGAVLRRNAPLKASFNVVQWSLAAVAGSILASGLAGTSPSIGRAVAVVVAGLALTAVVNQLCVAVVLTIVNVDAPRRTARGLFGAVLPTWGIGWATNVVIGALFVLAFATHPAAAVLFPLPLVALHLAQQAAARAAADRQRSEAAHVALGGLVGEGDVDVAVPPFLDALAAAFRAERSCLVEQDGHADPTVRRSGGAGDEEADALERAVVATGGDGRVSAEDAGPIGAALRASGRRSCSFVTVEAGGTRFVALLVDEDGFEGSVDADLALLRSVALDVAGRIAQSRLVRVVVEERRKLAEIVGNTSDGIFTVDDRGVVRTWNPAMERISGIPAAQALGSASTLAALDVRALNGMPVDLARWTSLPVLPTEIRLTATSGDIRRLSCSHSGVIDELTKAPTLVVVARDISPTEEMETLRVQFGRLAEVEAAQRSTVDQLQQAVMPPLPQVTDVELAVRYVSSDPAAPTGGDLYDCQVLPSGEVHLAVIDVLGHGVEATRHAVMAMHTLRVLAVEGCSLEQIVERADAILDAQDPELVATVMLGRYRPGDGWLRLAGGGHPNPLHASLGGTVQEVPAPGGPIGWPQAGSRGIVERRLAVGDSIVLYTDGVVEARKDLLTGTEQLLHSTARLAQLPADMLAQRLLDDALEGAARRDDSLLLVLRRVDGSPTRRWEAVPGPEQVGRIRRELQAWLRAAGCAEGAVEDAALVASELVTNAVRAARQLVEIDAVLLPDGLRLAVADDGPGFPSESPATVAPDEPVGNGRGLPIVHALAGNVLVRSSPAGSTVHVVLPSVRTSCPVGA